MTKAINVWKLTKEQASYLTDLICSRSSMVREHLREPLDTEELQYLKEEDKLLDSFKDMEKEYVEIDCGGCCEVVLKEGPRVWVGNQ
jgi:hypothetical protein